MKKGLIDKATELMISVNRAHKHLISERTQSFGLCITAHKMLLYLSKHERCLSQKEFAENFFVTPAAITTNLKKLESAGYITRTTGSDSRFNEIAITEEGKIVVEKTYEYFRKIDATLFSEFSEEDLENYIELTSRMLENIKGGETDEKMV